MNSHPESEDEYSTTRIKKTIDIPAGNVLLGISLSKGNHLLCRWSFTSINDLGLRPTPH
jgi:hypothetical protein